MNMQTVAKAVFFLGAVAAIGMAIAKSDGSYLFGVLLGHGLTSVLDMLSGGEK